MALEKPSIIQVKNNIVQIALPYWEGAPETYLTAALAATGTAATVKSNERFVEDDYVILGNIGSQQAEIKRITAAVTVGTSLTVAAVTFPHPVGERVVLSHYDQVCVYASPDTDASSAVLVGAAVNLDVRRGYTEISIPAADADAYYFARFYDSNANTYSQYSSAAIATGLSSRTRGEIKKEFLSAYNERLDDLISDDWMNRTINSWQKALLQRRKQWSCLRSSEQTTTEQDVQRYALPDDIQDTYTPASIISVKWYNKPELQYVDSRVFTGLTSDHVGDTLEDAVALIDTTISPSYDDNFADSGTIYINGDEITYTGKSGGDLTGVTGITATHSIGDEVWQTYTAGEPNLYTIDNGYVKLYPIPNSAAASKGLLVEYWMKFPDLDDDTDETPFINPDNCTKYMFYQAAIRRRLPSSEIKEREQAWRAELEDLVSDDHDFRDICLAPHNLYPSIY